MKKTLSNLNKLCKVILENENADPEQIKQIVNGQDDHFKDFLNTSITHITKESDLPKSNLKQPIVDEKKKKLCLVCKAYVEPVKKTQIINNIQQTWYECPKCGLRITIQGEL